MTRTSAPSRMHTVVGWQPTEPFAGGPLLVEASAGTGKTHALTGLVLRLIAEHGLRIDQILLVTFTRAAAAELRDRVRDRIGHAVQACAQVGQSGAEPTRAAAGDDVLDLLLRQASGGGSGALARVAERFRHAQERFDDATIDTIHGFCQRALAAAAPDVDLDLESQLSEDLEELLGEVVADWWVTHLRPADPVWYQLLRDQSVTTERLHLIARRLAEEPHLRLVPEHLPRWEGDVLDQAQVRQRWSAAVAGFRAAWRAHGPALVAWLEELRAAKVISGPKYGPKEFRERPPELAAWCDEADPPLGVLDCADALAWAGRARLEGVLGDGAVPAHLEVVDRAQELADLPRDLVTEVLRRFAEHARDEIARRKTAQGLTSFSDLLTALDHALADSQTAAGIRATLRARYRVALIDEFQDTDPVQWRIFSTLFAAPSDSDVPDLASPEQSFPELTLVGDPKQAIYGFRGADVDTYLEAARSLQAGPRRTLTTNWRSDQRYLDALQVLFGRDGFADEGVFAVDDIAHVGVDAADDHRDDRLLPPGQPTLHVRFVPRAQADEPLDGAPSPPVTKLAKGWAWTHLPPLVAHEIVALLEEGRRIVQADGAERLVAPRDIAVLVRTNAQARRVQAALSARAVPAVVGTDQSVLASDEALAVQRLLDAVLRPAVERAVRPALVGPLVGCAGDDLAAPTEQWWDERADELRRWGVTWRQRGVMAAVRQVLADRGAAARLLAARRGERILTNLLHVADLLHVAEARHRLGPEGLAAWLRQERHAERPTSDDLELRLESDDQAVTISTVHRAKGLQYPIVWCPFLWDGQLLGTPDKQVLRFHDPAAGGVLSLDVGAGPAGVKGCPRKFANQVLAEDERWRENVRVAYVALTRAQHLCVVHTGAFTSSGSSASHRLLHAAPNRPKDKELPDDDTLRADLEALAEQSAGTIEVADVATAPSTHRWAGRKAVTHDLQVRKFERPLDHSWQRTSFSRLVADDLPDAPDGGPEEDGTDHDHAVGEAADPRETDQDQPDHPVAEQDGMQPVPLADFPRGADAGTFLHHAMEDLDFADLAASEELARVVRRRLRPAGLGLVDVPAVVRGLRAVVATPLGPIAGGASLAAVGRADRVDELGFDLPLAGGYDPGGEALTVHRIAEVLDDHAEGSPAPLRGVAARLRRRPARPATGFLTGSIDLVARVDGRYLVVDYKSNWLGRVVIGPQGTNRWSHVGHYHPTVLAREMVRHDYVLQYHLYLVAIHRLLRWRLGADYDYDRHVAGVAYLFLRGMVGADTPTSDEGTPHGVYTDRPSRALVGDLDQVLRGGPR